MLDMDSFRTKNLLSPTRQLKRVGLHTRVHTDVQTGVRGTAHWWMLGTAAPLAACGSDDNPTSAPVTPPTTNDPVSNVIPLQDATVAGNDTIIDLDGVFGGGTDPLTLTASLGTLGLDSVLTLSDAVFTEGTHTITVTATDADGDKAEATVELVSDKTPTIANALPDAILASNTTAIDLDGVFDNGSGNLTLTSSFGNIGVSKLILGDSALPDTLTITFTATDADGDTVEESVVVISGKTLIIANTLQDATVAGNDATIDLHEVFESSVDNLTFVASLGTVGTNDKLTLSNSVFTEGTHTITITATNNNNDTLEETVVLVSDKTPTVANIIYLQDEPKAYDRLDPFVGWFFSGGSGDLTLTASHGTTIGTDDKLILGDYAAAEGTYTITLTATDADGDTVENTHIIITDYVPTIANVVADASFKGNGSNTINLAGVFDGGSGKLTFTASAGTIGSDNTLTLVGSDLVNGVNIFTITATDTDGDTIKHVVKVISNKFPTIANALDDATVVGNDTIIDLEGVFESVYGDHTLAATLGSIGPDNMLTLSDAVFTEGTHTITITATDADGDPTEEVFALVSDKTPTIAAALPDTILKGNTPVIDLNGVFDGGSGDLNLASSLGSISSDGMFTLSDAVFTENTHTVTFTATDPDGDAVEETVEVISDQTLIAATPLQDATVAGNDTTIDLSGVFESSVGSLSLDTSLGTLGTDNKLTLSDAVFIEGTHTITITATDGNNDALEETFVLVSDKTPTVATALADASITGNDGTIIDLAAVFANGSGGSGGSGDLTFSASAGMVGSDNTLTLAGSDLVHGVNAFTVTATDADGDATTDVFQINATKTFAIAEDAVATFYGAFQHSTQTFDVEGLFITAATSITFATSTLPSGISLSGSTLSFANTDLSEGAHAITITATDDNLTLSHTLTYALDAILDQSGDGSDSTYIGTTLADAISDNSFRREGIENVYLHGGVGGDTISNNSIISEDFNPGGFVIEGFEKSYDIHSITFEGGDGHDTISSNTLTAEDSVVSITFDGGDGQDTISGNAVHSSSASTITFDGGAGNDTISDNTLSSFEASGITFDGGAGNDTISGNTISARANISGITFDGGAGNDTISDNHFETTSRSNFYDGITSVTLMGGAGDDVFSGNTASQANGRLPSMTIDGGDGEDTVVFRSIAFEYAGISDWIDFSDGGMTTITLTGDGAAVTLINVETIVFADGTNFTAADAAVEGNGGISFDLANAFAGTFTAYSTNRGSILGNTLTLAGSELAHGANAILVTATATDNTETIETITVNAVRNLEMIGLKQHSQQTFDLGDVFAETNTTTYTATHNGLALPSGVTLGNGNLTFNNAVLSIGEQPITVTATDGSYAHTLTLSYTLDAIKDQITVSDGGSNTTYTGTTLADAITGNTFVEKSGTLTDVKLFGGDGDDTISSNTLTARDGVSFVTFDAGDGNNTISDNHFESSGMYSYHDVWAVLAGGAGDDVFRDNTASEANGELASLFIVGGDGEDTVVFRSVASDYDGLSQWIDSSDGGVTTITLSGDGAAVTLIDVETVSFADGASYNAADAWVEGSEETLYDLTNAFPDGTFTAYSTDSGTITGNTLTLAGTEFSHGANTILVTATATDNAETTETITVNAVKTLKIIGKKQHDQQTFDLGDVFVETAATTYAAINLPSGVILDEGTLTFNNTLSVGNHPITIAATDGNEALTLTLNYALEAIKDQSGDGSYSSYTGTTLADAITENSFVGTSSSLHRVYLDGGAGDDAISSNTFTAGDDVYNITFDGGAGDDAISSNTLTASDYVYNFTFDGGEGSDTISNNTFTADDRVFNITVDGGAENDTISSNTLTAIDYVYSITFDGGAGNDTISSNTLTASGDVKIITFDGGDGDDVISDNHLGSTGEFHFDEVDRVTLMGGAGDDVFNGNTATQANGELSSITIDGGADTDKVYFALESSMFLIKFGVGGYGSNITVTDKEARTEEVDGVDSYAQYVLRDIEELYFADDLYAF